MVKNTLSSAEPQEAWVQSPRPGRDPLRRYGNPLSYSCSFEDPHAQRSLGGLQSIGHQESEMTEAT